MSRRQENSQGVSLTRANLVRRAAVAAAPLFLGPSFLQTQEVRAARAPRAFAISATALAQVRRNVFELKLEYARRAWARTLAKANALRAYEPAPTRPDTDLSDWRASVYLPGLHDGNAALTLAVAYAVGGQKEHAVKAKSICLAWARTYRPIPAQHRIGHFVAEPVGAVIKLCMAYDLVKPTFTKRERSEFASWTAQFVARGRTNADFARDKPWVSDVVYGEDRTNPAPYGNSATWQRAMAVWAAATVEGSALLDTLEWNFQHRTPAGHDYGWDNLLEGLVLDGTGGQLTEDRYRSSIEYGHFSWFPLVLIADVARNASFRVDLFDYSTKEHGYTLFTPVSYYARFLSKSAVPDTLEKTQYGGSSWPTTASRWRAAYEVLYRNTTDPQLVRTLRRVVNHGGPRQRGANYDVYVLGHAALFGRGPKGPLASAQKRTA